MSHLFRHIGMQTKPKLKTRKTKQALSVSVTALALLALGACGTETGAGAGSGAGGDRKDGGAVQADLPLTGVRWTAVSSTVDGKKAAAPKGVYVEIDDKGAVKGNYGCNTFTGRATVKGDAVTLDKLMSTQMACEQQDFELSLRKAFKSQLKAKLDDGRLTLTTAAGDTVALTSKPVEPDAPLTGTKWTVDSFVAGETAKSVPAGTAGKAYLTFGEDGSVRGRTGCNSLTGKAKQGDGTLEFGRIATTRMMCQGEGAGVEKQLLEVLSGKVAFRVDGSTLTLTTSTQKSLTAKSPH
ncbi:META domain-containing protein [Streptomyces sp. NPDC058657]|uniref:META domain-containing protein n=1 Tax=unclassified Streptomyces TaxID=2593676 RepID=UPI00365B02C4